VSSGPEFGAYYHEFFLRGKPQLAAQMFCNNIRSKIAMATPDQEDEPIPLETNPVNEQPAKGSTEEYDAAMAMDLQTQMLMQQQVGFMKQMKQQQQMEMMQKKSHLQSMMQSQLSGLMDSAMGAASLNDVNFFQGNTGIDNWAQLSLQQQLQEMQDQKKQTAHMAQLKQLVALKLHQRQQKLPPVSTNVRNPAA
jgi:hypothetical protein